MYLLEMMIVRFAHACFCKLILCAVCNCRVFIKVMRLFISRK